MNASEKQKLLRQILWDYQIPVSDVEAVLNGDQPTAGHYTREKLIIKLLESYPWFTIIRLISPEEIKEILTPTVIKKLRTKALQQNYEFIRQRLHQAL
ncbi:MAG: hypothetical protein K9N36_01690 [Candidatus Marinimicrobia bacterium]|nr:hypothetical protein [Candidatus Neomarinimicrobiota bacterium]